MEELIRLVQTRDDAKFAFIEQLVTLGVYIRLNRTEDTEIAENMRNVWASQQCGAD